MKRVLKVSVLSWLIIAAEFTSACADSYPRNPNIDVQRYSFRITLSDQNNEIIGEAEITIKFLAEGISDVRLDLVGSTSDEDSTGMHVESITHENENVHFSHKHDRLLIRLSTASKAGENRTYTISYRGIPADGLIISKNKYGDRTFFGDNWPNRAHNWLPTVDHPSDKASCEFLVTAPNHYQVVANGLLVEETDLSANRRLTHWQETTPLPTKVMVIGAARFAVQYLTEYEDISVQSWVYPQNRNAGFYDFAQAMRILQYFDRRIGNFPYGKLANVQSKTRYGGMENASAIFYHENAVNGTRENERLLAHEIAHQWFGDSVTEADWHHIWLSEGLATYFALLYLEDTHGRKRLIDGLETARDRVFSFYKNNPNSTIVDTTIVNLNRLLNPNSYQKAGWMLHMLRGILGDDLFWKGIQEYYGRHRHQNVLTRDFQRVMEMVSGEDLSWFFRQWLYAPGYPEIAGSWTYNAEAKELVVHLNQIQKSPHLFRMPIEFGIYTQGNNSPKIGRRQATKREHIFRFELQTEPTKVELDPNHWLLMKADFNRK
ncbi:M1 family metallopeptidase [candidate division KSB1 bacterium]|nr:M1 family metallopeptidase [candidate division KSB1 bacterium]NIR72944.1 M1 family metallopeptidase [candidate division KSB1 bacterium]NIS28243.1 M1 family metallopeptidase [candidate division KSB1 bacterium]NIT75132.1 M1 family metallopeptidase [candidate division KSB1 bacterium]NIU28920.1 M1 family metallopeptidase [candidate division KSB1 bacterium]